MRIIFALLLPILALAGWLFQEQRVISQGELLEFKVRGYDPRDLLAGHYIRYQIDYGSTPVCSSNDYGQRCVCINPGTNGHFATASSTKICNDPQLRECPLYLKGTCNSTQNFEAGIERVYFPETFASKLVTLPENATVKVYVDKRGRGVVTEMFVAGKTLSEFVASAPSE